jgi:glycerate-2-kinase
VHTALQQVRLDQSRDGDLRCDCGKLLARVVRAVLELKCPRCKRVVLIAGGQRFEPRGAPPCSACPTFPEDHNPF